MAIAVSNYCFLFSNSLYSSIGYKLREKKNAAYLNLKQKKDYQVKSTGTDSFVFMMDYSNACCLRHHF